MMSGTRGDREPDLDQGRDGCAAGELEGLYLLEGLDAEQLARLDREGECRTVAPGWVCRQGDPAQWLFVLLSGQLALVKSVGGDDIEFSRTSRAGAYGGAVQAYFDQAHGQTYSHSIKALQPCRLFVLPAAQFAILMREWFPMAVHLSEGLFFGTQSAFEATAQRERLLAMGSISAGLAHELDNPAAAAVAATRALKNRVRKMRQKFAVLAAGQDSRSELARLLQLQEAAVDTTAEVRSMTPVEGAARQDELTSWLEAYDIADGWDLAPTFVQGGLETQFLDAVADAVGVAFVDDAVRWLNYTVETELLLQEVSESTNRISALVQGVKQYTQLGRAPFQLNDVHELLDSTLLMLKHRFSEGAVEVIRDYDDTLPHVDGYPTELNQVWTNLIENALDAMAGAGALTLRTRRNGPYAIVEIVDTGPGIAPELRTRIFDAFFTTKPFGAGTGLGLDVASRIVGNRHGGRLSMQPRAHGSAFIVELPLAQQARPGPDMTPPPGARE
jgi:signal transduction histidine kinase